MTNELVPMDSGNDTGALPVPFSPEGAVGRVWTGIDRTTVEGKALFLKALARTDLKGADARGVPLSVVNAVCHEIELEDEQHPGELVQAVRTCFVTREGKVVAFVSAGIWGSLGHLCRELGNPPWQPPIIIQVVESQSRKGRRVYTLDLIGLDYTQEVEHGKKAKRGGA